MLRASREAATSCVSWEYIDGSSDGSTVRSEMVSSGRYRSIAKRILSSFFLYGRRVRPKQSSRPLLCANAAQIGFVEANESGLVSRIHMLISSMDTWKLPMRQSKLRS